MKHHVLYTSYAKVSVIGLFVRVSVTLAVLTPR